MKFMWVRFLVALWASFMVATVGPVIFNGLFAMTAPVTCPGGQINVQTDTYNPRPGETDTTFTPLCTIEGDTHEVPTLAAMGVVWAGSFVPLLLIMLVLPGGAFGWMSSRNRSQSSQVDWQDTARRHQQSETSGPGAESLWRLKELKQARDSGLITEEEYEAKHQEILKGM